MKYFALILVVFMVLLSLGGCQKSNDSTTSPATESQLMEKNETPRKTPQYQIKIEMLESITQYSLAVPPASFEDKIMLTFSNQIESSGFNTALYQLSSKEIDFLDFYAGLEFKMDKEHFYYLSNEYAGGELALIKRKNQDTDAEDTIYRAPEGFELAPRLAYGDGFLVWAQYEPTEERSQGFSLWAFDINRQQAFEISERCYGSLTYSYIINNGCVAYYDEDNTAQNPYMITGYDLNKRKKAGEIATKTPPNTIVFDGKRYLWSEKSGERGLYVSDGNDTSTVAKDVGNFDIFKGEYIVASVGGDYQVINLIQNSVIFSLKDQGIINQNERLIPFFTLNKDTGRAVINSMVKQSSTTNASEQIYVLDFIEQTA
ncbi:MAG: hypothetical protein RR413_05760 [Christensenellaceae bacterium]